MMEPEPATPGEIIVHFLGQLPVTIKSSVLHQCWFGMGNDDLVSLMQDDIVGELRAMLDKQEGSSAAYACARLIGVLELVLEPNENDLEKLNSELYDETGVEIFRSVAMRWPLNRRHWQAAREEFYKLRQDALSTAALHKWQTLLWGAFLDEENDE